MNDTPNDVDEYLTASLVRKRYGGISDMTLYRWLNDEEMNFPRPYYFGRYRYFRLSELLQYECRLPRYGAVRS